MPLEASPGTRAEYSDIGFILLGKALEVLAREPLDIFCAREIFAPLALTATRYQPPPAWRALIPPTVDDQTFRGRIIQGEVHDENCSVLGGVSGHAGLFSNALDVLRYASCIISNGSDAIQPDSPLKGHDCSLRRPFNSLRLVKIRPLIAPVPWDGTLPLANRHLGVILAHTPSGISAIRAPHYGSISNVN